MRAAATREPCKYLSLLMIEGAAETPIKDAVKLCLISAAASSLAILSLFAFAEISHGL